MGTVSAELRNRLIRLREVLAAQPHAVLTPIPEPQIDEFRTRFTDAPDHLVALFREIGSANINLSGYVLCFWMQPDEIYDPATAAELGRLVIVGVDTTGDCEAYDPANNWRFGVIGASCRFDPYGEAMPTLIDFLEHRYADSL
jgi:hypothetical protein